MAFHRAMWALAIGILLASPVIVRAETAKEAFAKGKTLLAKGNVEAAMNAFAAAARADQAQREYVNQYLLARRIVTLRQRLEVETDPERWAYAAKALHALYCGEGMLTQAVSLGKSIHDKSNDAASAILLAETQLALNQNEEAARVLSALDAQKATPSSRALLGVALARQGKRDESREIAKSVKLGDDAEPQVWYTVARLHGVMGNSSEALSALARCFESLPPSRTANYQEHARACPDFAGLAASETFAKALATPSKVQESACSGGSGCANCPMRGKCGKSQSKQDN